MNLQAIANPSGVSLEDKVNDTGGAVSRSHEIVNVSPTKIVGIDEARSCTECDESGEDKEMLHIARKNIKIEVEVANPNVLQFQRHFLRISTPSPISIFPALNKPDFTPRPKKYDQA